MPAVRFTDKRIGYMLNKFEHVPGRRWDQAEALYRDPMNRQTSTIENITFVIPLAGSSNVYFCQTNKYSSKKV